MFWIETIEKIDSKLKSILHTKNTTLLKFLAIKLVKNAMNKGIESIEN